MLLSLAAVAVGFGLGHLSRSAPPPPRTPSNVAVVLGVSSARSADAALTPVRIPSLRVQPPAPAPISPPPPTSPLPVTRTGHLIPARDDLVLASRAKR
jgi:hypothetical protein